MLSERDLPECIGFTFNCNSTVANCRNSAGFDFPSLWTISEQYFDKCPTGSWLFKNVDSVSTSTIALTNEICKEVAGEGYTKYPGPDIWNRLTTWKFPLFQLVVNSPRPPLGFWVEAFTFAHFLGDPIGTITDVLRKVDSCQSRAMFWQDQLDGKLQLLRKGRDRSEQRRLWKSLAIIVDSFDEWGPDVGDKAQDHLSKELAWLCLPSWKGEDSRRDIREQYLKTCLTTADALAADRSTKFLPVVIAQAFFVGSIAIAMIRTQSASESSKATMFANVEMFSIAFTAQYFWVTFVVVWKSIIGTSQTAAAIPRMLSRLQEDLKGKVSDYGMIVDLPIDETRNEEQRKYSGGIYSWQPARKWMPSAPNSALERRLRRTPSRKTTTWQRLLKRILDFWPVIQYLLPTAMVAIAAGTGQLISALIPPVGWNCRNKGMLWMFVTWVASYIVSLVPIHSNWTIWFWVTMVKDLLAVGVTMGIVMTTQFGVYNRCDCFTQYGRVGLQLPSMPAVRDVLDMRMHSTYPAILAVGLALQLLLIPGLLVWRYHAAVQVFLQRDDGASNLETWHKLRERRRERQDTEQVQAAESERVGLVDGQLRNDETVITVNEMEQDVTVSRMTRGTE